MRNITKCYTRNGVSFSPKFAPENQNSSTVLVFGCQDAQDQYQDLAIGSCGIWINDKLVQFCLFHDDSMTKSSIEKIKENAPCPVLLIEV
ncbi:MAG: hypothetical protein KC444_01280 [Nitrosopumilus sp.]|nr:hypothetical protein [Nitrosopumilus sp.]